MDTRFNDARAHLESLRRYGGGDHPLANGLLLNHLVRKQPARTAPEPMVESKRGLRARRMTPKRV